MPGGIWLVALLAIAVAITLEYTRFGRHLFSIGSNERTARLCGVAVDRTKVAVYTIAAALTGVAGVLQFSRLSVGDPTVADGLELDVIAAVIIGGGSLAGGRGTVPGTILGAATMAVIQIGCAQRRLAQLGAADRHRRDHRPGRRAGSVEAEGGEAGVGLGLRLHGSSQDVRRLELASTWRSEASASGIRSVVKSSSPQSSPRT